MSGTGKSRTGTALADTLIGGFGDDSIDGLGGNDSIDGQAGSDLIRGGDGNAVGITEIIELRQKRVEL